MTQSSKQSKSSQSSLHESVPSTNRFARAQTTMMINILNLENDLPSDPLVEVEDPPETAEQKDYKKKILIEEIIKSLSSKYIIKETL